MQKCLVLIIPLAMNHLDMGGNLILYQMQPAGHTSKISNSEVI